MTADAGGLWPLLVAGFGVAFLHASLPTHWLPFVLAGRAQGWRPVKTLAVTALAGGGHVAFTVALGLLVLGAGVAVDRWMSRMFPWLAGGVLVAFGLYYLRRQVRGGGHGHAQQPGQERAPPANAHGHEHERHAHPNLHDDPPTPTGAATTSDRAVVLGLLTMLTFSPCEGFLPVFLAGARHGWAGYLGLSGVLALATWLGMLAFAGLALEGLQRFESATLARHENTLVGTLLLLLGIGIWVFRW